MIPISDVTVYKKRKQSRQTSDMKRGAELVNDGWTLSNRVHRIMFRVKQSVIVSHFNRLVTEMEQDQILNIQEEHLHIGTNLAKFWLLSSKVSVRAEGNTRCWHGTPPADLINAYYRAVPLYRPQHPGCKTGCGHFHWNREYCS